MVGDISVSLTSVSWRTVDVLLKDITAKAGSVCVPCAGGASACPFEGQRRSSEPMSSTLYSLRHTYATLALLEAGTDIHTLSKQMGNSAAMIERHYSKLTATMAAAKLA